MKSKHTRRINLTEWGKDEWEMTAEYRAKVGKITHEITDKYSVILGNERNWFKKLLIRLRCEMEIRKEVDKLSSMKNLHALKPF